MYDRDKKVIILKYLQSPLHYAASSTHGGICLEILLTEGASTKIQVGFSS